MNHFLVLPIVIPLFCAVISFFFWRSPALQKVLGVVAPPSGSQWRSSFSIRFAVTASR